MNRRKEGVLIAALIVCTIAHVGLSFWSFFN
jgi:hypothetical protein